MRPESNEAGEQSVRSVMTSIIELGACKRLEGGLDPAWCAFNFGALNLALGLRDRARRAAAGMAVDRLTDPDDAVVQVLEELIRLGDELLEPMELADDTILEFDHVLRKHRSNEVSATSWLGVVASAQTLAENVARDVAGMAEHFEAILADLEGDGTDAPEDEFVATRLSGSIAHIRFLLTFVEQPGEIAKA